MGDVRVIIESQNKISCTSVESACKRQHQQAKYNLFISSFSALRPRTAIVPNCTNTLNVEERKEKQKCSRFLPFVLIFIIVWPYLFRFIAYIFEQNTTTEKYICKNETP